MAWHKTKLPTYHTSIEQETWRQRLNKETAQTKDVVAARIKELEAQLNEQNSYYNNFKKPEHVAAAQATAAAEANNARGFDKVFDLDDE